MRIEGVEPPVILDTDLIQCFLSVNDGIEVLMKTLGNEIYVTGQVLEETRVLYHWPERAAIPKKLDGLVRTSRIACLNIFAHGRDALQFEQMTSGDFPGLPAMGIGEAAALILAKTMSGTVASNNLRDVKQYCLQNKIPLICLEDVLGLAVSRGHLTEELATKWWDDLKSAGHRLPSYDFHTSFSRFTHGCPL